MPDIIVDMHTHSVFSHDSKCEIEDMCKAQIEKGAAVFAVTDHCDIFEHDSCDIFTPIKNSCETVNALNEKYKDKCLILSGVEIGDVAWSPSAYEKVHALCDYDVIIGSVHDVKYKQYSQPFSQIDFNEFTEEELYEFLSVYFENEYDLAKNYDIDILAHLTSPTRYIRKKCGKTIDISRFYGTIDLILKTIIERGIALEINTAWYGVVGDFCPNREIIKRYYDMGGRLITVGSDTHGVNAALAYFEEAHSFLIETGFKYLYYYQKRKPVKYEIKKIKK